MTQTILLTGAAGNLGNQLRPYFCAHYEKVILSDCVEITSLAENEQFCGGFLDNAVAMKEACTGVDAIVHMGGKRNEGQWDAINTSNIQGFITLMEAAHSAGVKRMVFASSNHSIGMYGRRRRIGTGDKVRPDSRYGLSKAFGEALACSMQTGTECAACRSGSVMRIARHWIGGDCQYGCISKTYANWSRLALIIPTYTTRLFLDTQITVSDSGTMQLHFNWGTDHSIKVKTIGIEHSHKRLKSPLIPFGINFKVAALAVQSSPEI